MISRTLPLWALSIFVVACGDTQPREEGDGPAAPAKDFVIQAGKPVESLPGETWFGNVRQLTFGGENAEAYWSNDGTRLILQSKRPPFLCDQIFTIDLASGETQLVSTGKGRTTCSYYLQGDRKIIYASTHLADEDCPPQVFRVDGRYVWAVYKGFDLFVANPDGSDLERLTRTEGYDAEATLCPVTGRIVFTSVRDGDLELYSMQPDGSDLKRLTHRTGYDGGAFYSHDGTKIVQRSGFPKNPEEEAEYLSFLEKGVVVPSHMEITIIDRDGSNFRQVTDNGKANFGPFWHPDDRRIIFASNLGDPKGRDFELYLIDEDGQNLVQLTHNPTFDGFPMFSPDGKHLAFASNRFGKESGETNVFIAQWIEGGGQ